MKSKELRRAVTELGPWYQRYDMGKKIYTTDKDISGEKFWPTIRSLMREDLFDARILDIGSNAGYYSVMLALEGADVIAVEPSNLYFKQARWTKFLFEQKYDQKLSVFLKQVDASSLNYKKLGHFDYILAFSVIYHIGKGYSKEALEKQRKIVSQWCKISDNVMVRTRNNRLENSIPYYNQMFMENEFFMLKKVIQKRPIMLYGRLIKDEEGVRTN